MLGRGFPVVLAAACCLLLMASCTLRHLSVAPQLEGGWLQPGADPQGTRAAPYEGPATSALRWTTELGTDNVLPPVVAPSGMIYANYYQTIAGTPPDWEGGMAAFSSTDGTRAWSYNIGRHSGLTGSATVDSAGTAYFGVGAAGGGGLVAVDRNGVQKWTLDVPANGAPSRPALGASGLLYCAGSDGAIYAVDQSPAGGGGSPTVAWTFPTGDTIPAVPAIGHDGTVYFTSNTGGLGPTAYGVSPAGQEVWSLEFGYTTCEFSPVVGGDGTIYLATNATRAPMIGWPPEHGVVVAIAPNGTLKWEYHCDYGTEADPRDCQLSSGLAVDPNGTVWVGTTANSVIGVDTVTGTLEWSYATGGAICSAPAVDSAGRVYFGCDDGLVYAIQPRSGVAPACDLVWSHNTGAAVACAPAIGAGGVLYVGDSTGKLYAFGS